MIVLGIETSCDETAVAVLEVNGTRTKILSNLIASQHEIHLPFGGIFPELASRRHIEVIRPLVEEGLKQAGVPQKKLEGIAVTHAPGLVGSLLVGLSFAKAYALGLKIPFIGVNHLEGHLNAPFLESPKIPYPQIGLVVSGGHTALYSIKKFGEYQFLGGTLDDAAGEAFDKVAKLLGLGYPGGPEIDRLAKQGNPQAVKFPKPKMKGYDFSFSGLKTAVKVFSERERFLSEAFAGLPDRSHSTSGRPRTQAADSRRVSEADGRFQQESLPLADVCASFQETVVDILIEKTLAAAKARRCKTILMTGGVACNSRLREKMKKIFFATPVFCTDNAAMIAYVGGRRLLAGERSPLSLNAIANLPLGGVPSPLAGEG